MGWLGNPSFKKEVKPMTMFEIVYAYYAVMQLYYCTIYIIVPAIGHKKSRPTRK